MGPRTDLLTQALNLAFALNLAGGAFDGDAWGAAFETVRCVATVLKNGRGTDAVREAAVACSYPDTALVVLSDYLEEL